MDMPQHESRLCMLCTQAQLGYASGRAVVNGWQRSQQAAWLSRLVCQGDERDLMSCLPGPNNNMVVAQSSSGDNAQAGVICSNGAWMFVLCIGFYTIADLQTC